MSVRIIFKLGVIFGICIITVLSSCSSSNENVKIALLLGNMKAARWQKDKDNFLKEAQKLGCEGVVLDANFDEVLQLKQAEDLIKQGFKALAIGAVNSTSGAAIVRLAKENGVKIISYDGIISNCELDYMISFEDYKVGKLMAEYAVSKAKTGNYVILGGDKTNANSIDIRQGEEDVLSPYIKDGRIKVAYSDFVESWNNEEAYVLMRNYLKLSHGEKPAAVLVASDVMVSGVIRAFEEQNIPLPVITGQDASLDGCRSIMADKQTMTVYKPISKLAAMAADLAYKAAKGDKVDDMINAKTFNGLRDVPTVHVDIISVDKNNIESTVIADGAEKREDIMK